MPPADSAGSGWLVFTALTVVCWGLYGIFLHKGQALMGDPEQGRMKAFLVVGAAYLLVAVIGPLVMLVTQKANWHFTGAGVTWSLIAGAVGAVGAFGVLLAFGAKGSPAVVMSVIFAGAPVVNALVAIGMTDSWSRVRWPFVLGILMAASGAWMVSYFKPAPPPHPPASAAVVASPTVQR
ncbi:MAG: hypothetical protein R3F39_15045 [Myxococcota bacterium]